LNANFICVFAFKNILIVLWYFSNKKTYLFSIDLIITNELFLKKSQSQFNVLKGKYIIASGK
jgi:hypothetical protein